MRDGGKEREEIGANEKASAEKASGGASEKVDVVRSGREDEKQERKASSSSERKIETKEKRTKHHRKKGRAEDGTKEKKEHERVHRALKHGGTCIIA